MGADSPRRHGSSGSGTPNTSPPDYIRAVPTVDLPDDELAAVTAAIRGVIEGDRYPHAPRLDPLRAALARLDAAEAAKDLKADIPKRNEKRPQMKRPRRRPKPRSALVIKAKGPARLESAGPAAEVPSARLSPAASAIASMQSGCHST
jgi:hypothetical protein